MFLILMHVQSHIDKTPRGVSVWVDTDNAGQAQRMARACLAEAGLRVVRIDSTEETAAEDYFRTCPSQQAFQRAQAEGVAWRFDSD